MLPPVRPSVFSPGLDFLFILAPFWVSLLYFCSVGLLPDWRPTIFFIFFAVLGETHFGATALFFLPAANRAWLWRRRVMLIFVPLSITTMFLALGLVNLRLALLVSSLTSGIHVTRQSIGMFRLYGGKRNTAGELLIYLASIMFLSVGFARFYLPVHLAPDMLGWIRQAATPLGLCGAVAVAVALTLLSRRTGLRREFVAVITGCALYSPYIFVAVPQDAVAMGVGMHWCQYLALTGAVYGRQANRQINGALLRTAAVAIMVTAVAMAWLHTSGGTQLESNSLLVLIPLCVEIYHYYLDAFIWRFSDQFIRENVGRYVFSR